MTKPLSGMSTLDATAGKSGQPRVINMERVMRRLLPAMTWVGCVGFLIAPAKVSAQTDFDAFWLRFKTALINDNKPAVADLTRFPLLMPFGTMSVKSRNAFLDHYDQIVNM